MNACKYCLQCESSTISAVASFVDNFPNVVPAEEEIHTLMDNAEMDDWFLKPSSFSNMRFRLIPLYDDNLISLTITSSGDISCSRTSDDETTIHR